MKMRPLGWALGQYAWCPYKKGMINRQIRTEGSSREDTQGEDARVLREMRRPVKEHRGLLENTGS